MANAGGGHAVYAADYGREAGRILRHAYELLDHLYGRTYHGKKSFTFPLHDRKQRVMGSCSVVMDICVHLVAEGSIV